MRSVLTRPCSRFQGMSDLTQSCNFIDHILKGDIIKFKPFAAWLVAELVFAELRSEPSFVTEVACLCERPHRFPPPSKRAAMTAPAMTDAQNTSQDTSAACEVGYGKPPRHTQFRKGQSGNPGGRPRRQ